jgi:hypothetical protein
VSGALATQLLNPATREPGPFEAAGSCLLSCPGGRLCEDVFWNVVDLPLADLVRVAVTLATGTRMQCSHADLTKSLCV